jgi:hypothetical protein
VPLIELQYGRGAVIGTTRTAISSSPRGRESIGGIRGHRNDIWMLPKRSNNVGNASTPSIVIAAYNA